MSNIIRSALSNRSVGTHHPGAVRVEPLNEKNFQQWYSNWADTTGIDRNPDDPQHRYDYRSAYYSGDRPTLDTSDSRYHWPSAHKAPDHPNRFVRGVDTITGAPAK